MIKKRKEEEKEAKNQRQKMLGLYLQQLRNHKNLSVKEVAKAIGISNPYLYQIEYGKKALSDPKWFTKLSDFYSVPVEKLLRKAGYLPESASSEEELLNETMVEIINSGRFAMGMRLRGRIDKIDIAVKRFIMEMDTKVKLLDYEIVRLNKLLAKSKKQHSANDKEN
jgi:transcriptional regulator with XRE-family HTH domain